MMRPSSSYHPLSRIKKSFIPGTSPWLDPQSAAHSYWKSIWGGEVTRKGDQTISFYTFSSSFNSKILKATKDLHHLMLEATDQVINSDELLTRCSIPQLIWNKLRKSWKGPQNSKSFAGRFDFGLNRDELKLFEYNADSAGAYLETASIQNAWADAVGANVGESAAKYMQIELINLARKRFSGLVHIMIDDDDEEMFNAIYMKENFEMAGLQAEILVGNIGIRKQDFGFCDLQGRRISKVWKMWNWETITQQFVLEEKPTGKDARVCDVLMSEEVEVYEPIWKMVTSNKGLLPLIYEMNKDNPLLLKTAWELNDEIKKAPYIKKPIVGRCGQNIEYWKNYNEKVESIEGKFNNRDFIYQQAFEIQAFDGFFPVLGSWIVGDTPVGYIIREDQKLITDHQSPCSCSLVIADDQVLGSGFYI